MAEATGAREIMGISPVIPVVTVEDPKTAVPMAQALVEGGISIIEVTLRTPSALETLRRIVEEVPQMTAGAGTILGPRQADQAMDAGGTACLKAIAAPVPDVVFCPTGGISAANAPDYLGLSNVACVGGSWLTPKDAVAAGDCGEITRRAREAAALA